MPTEYKHIELNQEIESIGGRFTLTKEMRLPFRGRDVLVVTGHSFVDRSCCGMAGCIFANVPGYVTAWKTRETAEGLAVSDVETIDDEDAQKELTEIIARTEPHCQVNFV